MTLKFIDMHLSIKIRDLREGLGGDKPDFSLGRIEHAGEQKFALDISNGQGARLKLAERQSLLWSALGIDGDALEISNEAVVHDDFKLLGELLSLAATLDDAHLQILRSGLEISSLRRLEKSKNAAIGRGAAQRIHGLRGLGSWRSLRLDRGENALPGQRDAQDQNTRHGADSPEEGLHYANSRSRDRSQTRFPLRSV